MAGEQIDSGEPFEPLAPCMLLLLGAGLFGFGIFVPATSLENCEGHGEAGDGDSGSGSGGSESGQKRRSPVLFDVSALSALSGAPPNAVGSETPAVLHVLTKEADPPPAPELAAGCRRHLEPIAGFSSGTGSTLVFDSHRREHRLPPALRITKLRRAIAEDSVAGKFRRRVQDVSNFHDE